MIVASEALKRLREGNRRYVSDAREHISFTDQARRDALVSGQEPIAVVLGCSDSRVPAEIIFDQGLGDLFVIRVAGNIVAPSQVGSVEYAAEQLGTRLVVVLGHSGCGAVFATFEELKKPIENRKSDPCPIIDGIRPSVEVFMETDLRHNPEALVEQAVRLNIRASVEHLQQGSPLLKKLIENEGLVVVGAEYSLKTGQVEYFD